MELKPKKVKEVKRKMGETKLYVIDHITAVESVDRGKCKNTLSERESFKRY